MEVKGVLDRIEDDKYAVILVEEEKREIILDKKVLPIDIQFGDYLLLEIKNNEVTNITLKEKERSIKKNHVEDKMDKIKLKNNYSKFKKIN